MESKSGCGKNWGSGSLGGQGFKLREEDTEWPAAPGWQNPAGAIGMGQRGQS